MYRINIRAIISFLLILSYSCPQFTAEAESNIQFIKNVIKQANKMTPTPNSGGYYIEKYEFKNNTFMVHMINDESTYTMGQTFSDIDSFKSSFIEGYRASLDTNGKAFLNLLEQENINFQLRIRGRSTNALCKLDISILELLYGVDNSHLISSENAQKRIVTPHESEQNKEVPINNSNIRHSVDTHIPTNPININSNTFAVIIANEKYNFVVNVPYAESDGDILKQYLTNCIGLPENHVKIYKNASFGNIAAALKHIENLSDAFGQDLNLIFYYSGHGIPNEETKQPMLIPVDGDAVIPETCYDLNNITTKLGNLNANYIIFILDACFSGSSRGNEMLTSARGIRIKSSNSIPSGNMIILSASQGDETAYPYKDGHHGLFTYFLLKKLQDEKGDVTLGELSKYIIEEVKKLSVVYNGKLQTPTVSVSASMKDTWRNLKIH